ncbi:nucleotide sugar dehydrogenase [bacterium]|nr:nucleotide sugar dehydrogenase [bacterium]
MLYESFLKKIKDKSVIVGVIGLGYVGLPLLSAFSKNGIKTIGFDVDERKTISLKKGVSYIQDVKNSDIKKIKGLFKATNKIKDLNEADAILICVPTPLRKTKDPDISYIIKALETIQKLNYKGKLIVLESTTYPGTTEEILLPELENGGKYKVGKDFFLAFSPERVDPGNKNYNIENTTKVVGGVTKKCTDLTAKLYSLAIEKVYPVSSTRVAESVKLLENIYRSVNIGLINEMAQLCHRMGIDIWEIVNAAATKPYGFMPFYPGPGLGGHCIPLDPFYMSWKAKSYDFNTKFIELAGDVNGQMPYFVVELAYDILNKYKKAINGSNVLILGVAYKKNIDDLRESPAIDVMRILEEKGAKISYHDPYVASMKLGERVIKSKQLTPKLLKSTDIAILITDHTNIDYKKILDNKVPVLDTRNGLKEFKSKLISKL